VVHQGGVGTSAEALRSGRPMLVVPHCHDQPDNAHRLERLGVARAIPAERYTVRRATRTIAALLADSAAAERARILGAQIAAETGVATACDALEGLLGDRAGHSGGEIGPS
ncbi:MAG: glycosyltransferase, partial [Thermoanaerobaculia bacterium]|nr:glycosyltransferase [Thermoanaerobaculia bacterium]